MAKEQNKQISYHTYTLTFLRQAKASLVHSTEKQIGTLAKLLNKSKDSTHNRNKTFVNNI